MTTIKISESDKQTMLTLKPGVERFRFQRDDESDKDFRLYRAARRLFQRTRKRTCTKADLICEYWTLASEDLTRACQELELPAAEMKKAFAMGRVRFVD